MASSGSGAGGGGGEGGSGAGSTGGSGGEGGNPAAPCTSADECPGEDSGCSQRVCIDMMCGALLPSKGTPCNEDDGTLCDGGGHCLAWAPLSTTNAPSARYDHSAVWTGEHMIIWGGVTGPGQVTNSGHMYDPATDSWSAISAVGAPEPRRGHAAVWTGSHMLVWGGYGQNGYASDGAIYHPASDTWAPMATAGQPSPRTQFSAVLDYDHKYWIIWGGLFNATPLGSGSRYDITSNSWVSIPTVNAPSPRLSYAAAWVTPLMPNVQNGAMVVYGGSNTSDWLNDGGMLDPVMLTWTPINMQTGPAQGGAPPQAPLQNSAAVVLGGASLLIWGGWDGGNYYNDGYYLFPNEKSGGVWYGLASNGAPSARSNMIVLNPGFTGMFIWGGCGGMACSTVFDDGGLWTFGANGGSWQPIASDPALTPRLDAAAVSTGSEAIVWGGRMGTGGILGDGARRLINPP